MKITLNDISNGLASIRKLAAFDFGKPITNYKFMKTVNLIEENAGMHNSLIRRAIEKYCDKEKSDGSKFSVPPENAEPLNKEFDEISAIEIELDWKAVEVSVEALNGFTAKDMNYLDGLFINIKENSNE